MLVFSFLLRSPRVSSHASRDPRSAARGVTAVAAVAGWHVWRCEAFCGATFRETTFRAAPPPCRGEPPDRPEATTSTSARLLPRGAPSHLLPGLPVCLSVRLLDCAVLCLPPPLLLSHLTYHGCSVLRALDAAPLSSAVAPPPLSLSLELVELQRVMMMMMVEIEARSPAFQSLRRLSGTSCEKSKCTHSLLLAVCAARFGLIRRTIPRGE